MSRYRLIGACVFVIVGIVVVYAETKEPANGPELIKQLKKDYRIESVALDSDGNAIVAIVEGDRVPDVNSAITRLSRTKTLRSLTVTHARIEGKLLSALKNLRNLRKLCLWDCTLVEKDLAALKDLTFIEELDLSGTSLKDVAMVYVKPLTNLHTLSLDRTKLNGSGFSNLESLPLRVLHIAITPITDDSLQAIGRIKTLQELDLHDTTVSDEGIKHLCNLTRLVKLVLNKHVTVDGTEAFRKAHSLSRTKAENDGLLSKKYPPLKIIGGGAKRS